MSWLDVSDGDLYSLTWKEDVEPPIFVAVGEMGVNLYSTDREYNEGFQVYELAQGDRPIFSNLYDVHYANGIFMAVGGSGSILTSSDGRTWDQRLSGTEQDLYGALYLVEDIWLACGLLGTIIRSIDNGVTWSTITVPSSSSLRAMAISDSIVLAVGVDDVLKSTDHGVSWTTAAPSSSGTYRDIVYDGSEKFYIVGDGSILMSTSDGEDFTILTSPIAADLKAIDYAGTNGLFVAVGHDAATIISINGDDWFKRDSGIEDGNFNDVGFGDNRYVTVGNKALIAYSATGAGRPAFENFRPISDIYRAQCFTQQDAYMVYGGMIEFLDDKWQFFPRRIRSPAPGTVDDFTTVGHYVSDLPGTGFIMDMISVRGGIVIAESEQLSLLTDGGSLSLPWAYQKNFGEGIRPISNLTSFNGVAYVIADDGLIYSATSVGVDRLQGFFDLTRFEDWEPGSESAWIGFDPVYQTLFVFRQKSPWKVWLVGTDNGAVSEIELPSITVSGITYEPRSAYIVRGLHDGIHVSYAPTSGGSSEIINAKLNVDGPIVGNDQLTAAVTDRWEGEISTGSFRVTSIGLRGSCDEVLIRTWADPDSTTRPDLLIMVKEETEDDWKTDARPHGTINVTPTNVQGDGTAFSRYLARAQTQRTIDVTTEDLVVAAVNAKVLSAIHVTTAAITVAPGLVLVQHGQDNLQIGAPDIEIAALAVDVDSGVGIDVTTSALTVAASSVFVHRNGYYKLPWLVSQCDIYIEDIDGNRTLASYTKIGDFEIQLSTPLTVWEGLYVDPGAVRPFVLGEVGHYILTSYGAHRISAVNTAYDLELDWYPPVPCVGTYIPAQEIPEGGAEGDGKIIVGLGRGFDQLMIRVLLIAHDDCDADGSKITGIELGYKPTGPELKTDAT